MFRHARVAACVCPRTTCFVAVSAVLLACNLSAADRTMYGDAAGYWSLARTFTLGNDSSLDGYADHLRGYAVPFMLYCVQRLGSVVRVDEVVAFRIASALLASALFAIALPSFLSHLLKTQRSLQATASFCLLGLVYWHGHFLYSLSDLPALLLLTTGLLCLPAAATRPWRIGVALPSGACFALAANARPIYAVALLQRSSFCAAMQPGRRAAAVRLCQSRRSPWVSALHSLHSQ